MLDALKNGFVNSILEKRKKKIKEMMGEKKAKLSFKTQIIIEFDWMVMNLKKSQIMHKKVNTDKM